MRQTLMKPEMANARLQVGFASLGVYIWLDEIDQLALVDKFRTSCNTSRQSFMIPLVYERCCSSLGISSKDVARHSMFYEANDIA